MLTVSLHTFPVLETQRCVLRQMNNQDIHQLLYLRSDERILKYLDKEKMVSLEEASVLLEKIEQGFEKGEGVSWAVSLKNKNEMVGYAGIWRIDREHHRGELGYSLHTDLWNRGIMSEVLNKIIHFGFYTLNLHSLEANVNPGNRASIRLLEKLGFVREAYFREKFLDSVIYSLITPQMVGPIDVI